jgi:hypothetical protein
MRGRKDRMSRLHDAIEGVIREAYGNWTESQSISRPPPRDVPRDHESARSTTTPRSVRFVDWTEILDCVEAATDIAPQVEAELDRMGSAESESAPVSSPELKVLRLGHDAA